MAAYILTVAKLGNDIRSRGLEIEVIKRIEYSAVMTGMIKASDSSVRLK